MDANKRSEMNNQTNNNANEKWTPGAKGNTGSGPLDHTFPQGSVQQQGKQDSGTAGTQQSGMGLGARSGGRSNPPDGSMQTQPTGGTGAVQGITDSHQQAMEQRSDAYGELEQPLGDRPKGSGESLRNHPPDMRPATQATDQMNPQNPMQPELRSGTTDHRHGSMQSSNQMGDMPGPQDAAPSVQRAGSPNEQLSTDRTGSQTGGSEPATAPAESQRQDRGVHQSNDTTGGLPKSPRGANKLAGDQKMDDDTGLSRGS